MRNSLIALVVSMAACASTASAAEIDRLVLVSPEAQVPDIYVGYYASPAERFASQELQTTLEKMTGRKFTVRFDYWLKGAPGGRYIAVGHSELTKAIDTSGLTTEQYIIDIASDHLTLIGGRDRQRGVLYGVYDFLEELGVRWYRPEPWGEHVPQRQTLSLPLGRKTSKPPWYVYRSVLGGGFMRNAECTLEQAEWGSLWSLRNKMNGSDPGSDPRYGGQVSPQFEHIYYQLIPVEEYFDTHPEYFCLYRGQRRKFHPDVTPGPGNPTGLQLCLSNPGLQELFARKIIARARGCSDLSSRTFSVSPNDACPFCECEECRKMDDPELPELMSNRVCAFTNIIARKVAEAVPGARASLTVYSSWTAPPTIVKHLEPNIVLHIALINEWSDYTRNLLDPLAGWNRGTSESFRKWRELGASTIMTYEYWSGYGWLGPLPVIRTMADRIDKYRQFSIRGIYNETSPHWGPQGLELYMFSKLIWNPDLDVEKELNLYYRNYYGPAERPMKNYHEALMKALAESSMPVFSGGRGMHLVLRPRLVEQLGAYIDQAKKLVKGEVPYQRRLRGVVAGYEFAARVCKIVELKKQEGASVNITGSTGSYLKSDKAEQAYRDLVTFVRSYEVGDAVFDAQPHSSCFSYLEDDLLRNGAFGYRHEADLLKDF